MMGTTGMAALWALVVAATLLAWPWAVAATARRRPGWFTPWSAPSPDVLRAAWRGAAWPGRGLLAWATLALATALVPWGRGLVAADLDAGLLWIAALGVASWALRDAPPPDRRASGRTLAVLTITAVPVVARAASLGLVDIVLAQQGGVGNWYLLRDPFLFLAAWLHVAMIAALWSRGPRADRRDDPLAPAIAWGGPLLGASLAAALYLGGWWALVPALDGLPWLASAFKTLLVLAVIVPMARSRRVLVLATGPAAPWLALGCALGSLVWLVVGGGVR